MIKMRFDILSGKKLPGLQCVQLCNTVSKSQRSNFRNRPYSDHVPNKVNSQAKVSVNMFVVKQNIQEHKINEA